MSPNTLLEPPRSEGLPSLAAGLSLPSTGPDPPSGKSSAGIISRPRESNLVSNTKCISSPTQMCHLAMDGHLGAAAMLLPPWQTQLFLRHIFLAHPNVLMTFFSVLLIPYKAKG
jgi:hypothetical protein